MAVVLFFIFLLIPFSVNSMNDASKTIKQEIYDFSRGSYDILLRPENSRTEIENELGLVEDNYLGIGHGGITVEQWQNVLNRDDVEVAAPVAAIGLYTASGITYALPEREEPLRYNVEYFTTDGVNTYQLEDNYAAYSFVDPYSESYYSEIVEEPLVNVFSGEFPSFNFPMTYHQVVAIDLDEERKLTGESFSNLKITTSAFGPEYYDAIAVLGLEDGNIPLTASIQIDTINLTEDDIADLREKYHIDSRMRLRTLPYRDVARGETFNDQLLKEMAKKETISTENYVLDFSDAIHPFYDNYLYADENYRLIDYDETQPEYDMWGLIDYASQQTYYDVHPVNFEVSNDQITVKQVGTYENTDIPYYREIEEKTNFVTDGPDVIEGDPLLFNRVGKFKVTPPQELAASPLGIYGYQETYLEGDRDTQIHPTALPGSFITTPAHGLISIDWAERLKGETPIDAIRVRVAGIEGYDRESAEIIKNMAAEFEEQGFTVDIVAGASHQWLTIDVEGYGNVVQPWITLGAADTILQSFDVIRIVLTALFILASFVYLMFSFSNLIKARSRDEALLVSFGWEKKHLRRQRLKEWTTLLGLPFVIVFLALIAYIYMMDGTFNLLLIVSVVFLITCALIFLVSLYHNRKRERTRIPNGKGSVTWQNIWHYRRLITLSIVQIVTVSLISIFLPIVMAQQESRTVETTLGIYVHGEMEWFYTILLIFLFTLSILTLIETLISLWRQRSDEMTLFHHIGWSKKQLYKFYIREVAMWSAGSIVIGAFISLMTSLYLFESYGSSILWSLLISGGLYASVLIVSMIILINVVRSRTTHWYRKVV